MPPPAAFGRRGAMHRFEMAGARSWLMDRWLMELCPLTA